MKEEGKRDKEKRTYGEDNDNKKGRKRKTGREVRIKEQREKGDRRQQRGGERWQGKCLRANGEEKEKE